MFFRGRLLKTLLVEVDQIVDKVQCSDSDSIRLKFRMMENQGSTGRPSSSCHAAADVDNLAQLYLHSPVDFG